MQHSIQGITVHLFENNAMVMIPILKRALAGYSTKELDVAMGHLGCSAVELLRTTDDGKSLLSENATLESAIEHHKYEQIQLGHYKYLLPMAGADRAAFVVRLKYADGTDRMLCYFYGAMGLDYQHDSQQALLARVGHPLMAACLLKAAINACGHHTYRIQFHSKNERVKEKLETNWNCWRGELALPDAPWNRCAPNLKDEGHQSWL